MQRMLSRFEPPVDVDPQVLSAVIIARNEETSIGRCVESILRAMKSFDGGEVVLVDARSTDRTVRIASGYPIRIVRLRKGVRATAALGRVIGQRLTNSRYLLFADGDSEVNHEWVTAAVAFMDGQPDVGGVGGKLREVYYSDGVRVGELDDFFAMGNVVEVAYQLGGNALYRRAALERVGSFNPAVVSFEEAEVAARLRQAGFRLMRLPMVAAVHHTTPRGGVSEAWRRLCSGLQTGFGQVLRLTVGTPLFWPHARQLNRYLLCLGFLIAGIAAGVATLFVRDPVYVLSWIAFAAVLTTLLIVRGRNMSQTVGILADWLFAAPAIAWGFVRRPAGPQMVAVERLIERVGDASDAATLAGTLGH